MTGRFATLTFEREVQAPVATLWQAWTAPAARAVWAAPSPEVTVRILASATEVGGREVSLCLTQDHPDVRVEVHWLHLDPGRMAVNSELVTSEGATDAVALVTAEFSGDEVSSRVALTVQLCGLADHMAEGYAQGYGAGIANLAGAAERMLLIERVIQAPAEVVWGAWVNPATLPHWWGPEGYTCRTARIDLRSGGEWLFDMIGPDGKVWPNHHRYQQLIPKRRIDYTLHAGETGPKHADAWAEFVEEAGATRVRLGMVFPTPEDAAAAKRFGAVDLGLQTLGKLARFIGAD